jgi:hypothetical protein
MKSYPYCPPLPSGPEPTGPFKVDDGATAAVGGADDGAEGEVERGSESDYEKRRRQQQRQIGLTNCRLHFCAIYSLYFAYFISIFNFSFGFFFFQVFFCNNITNNITFQE